MGTPSEQYWHGVSKLPQYKPEFPKWKRQPLEKKFPDFDPDGIDLLKVFDSSIILTIKYFNLDILLFNSKISADTQARFRYIDTLISPSTVC